MPPESARPTRDETRPTAPDSGWVTSRLRGAEELAFGVEYLAKVPIATATLSVLLSRLETVLDLHQCRTRTVEGANLKWCRECGQNWPCPTVEAAEDAPTTFLKPQPYGDSERTA